MSYFDPSLCGARAPHVPTLAGRLPRRLGASSPQLRRPLLRALGVLLLSGWMAWLGGDVLAEDDDHDDRPPTPRAAAAEVLQWIPVEPSAPSTDESGRGIVGVDDAMGLPTVRPPNTRPTDGLQPVPELLPEGATGRFPGVGGDPFYVRLEPSASAELSLDEVASQVVDPVLEGLGFAWTSNTLQWAEPTAEHWTSVPAMVADVASERAIAELEEIDGHLLAALLEEAAVDDDLSDRALEASLGLDLATYRRELTAAGTIFTFLQHVGGVPVEGAGLFVRQRLGYSPDTVHGALYQNVHIGNQHLVESLAIEAADDALSSLEMEPPPTVDAWYEEPVLVLLPYGTDDSGVVTLRYAWRGTARLSWQGAPLLALLHVDAEDGALLAFKPRQGHAAVPATGRVYRRGPDVGPVVADFAVDEAVAGEYVLQWSPHILQVDMNADGLFFDEVAIAEVGNGSTPSFANFDQAPLDDATNIECNIPGPNRGFEEVNLFQGLYRNRQVATSFGIWQPFPAQSWHPRVSFLNTGSPVCNAYSSMLFEACQGFVKPNCPNFSGAFINHAHDRTVISHEAAHSAVPRLTDARPTNWCGVGACPLPEDWGIFHDLADFWAGHLENTNCIGGWTAKNFLNGPNGSFNCSPASDEGGLLPRLHDVATAFDPTDPSDHFPEHRDLSQGAYAVGQVAAAALWQARVGMRSRNRVAGHTLFWSRFQRALRFTGFGNFNAPAGSDRYVYQRLYDLQSQMMDEWTFSALIGTTSNKLQSGFARTGLFLIPPVCLDNNPSTADARYCPGGENGGAAVIDIDDNVAADDLTLDGVLHRESDYLELGGAVASFDVWTGPRWQFNGDTARPVVDPPKCNNRYWVEVSRDANFANGPSIHSGWVTVDTDVTTPASPECYGRWTPNALQWSFLTGGATAGTRLYYRVFTIDASGGNLMSSDQPGKALWQPQSPYAVMTADGRFARFREALGIAVPGGGGGSGDTQ